MENYEISKYLEDYQLRLQELSIAINIEEAKKRLLILEESMNEATFWTDNQKSSKVLKEIKVLKDKIETYNKLFLQVEDLIVYFEMHPGAGGTESQDWCEMLFRMYKRFCERRGFQIEVLDYQDGEEAGIKSVSFIVHGENAYGYLKSEQGVHRLIRISPFDSNARRHTSFCAVSIYPAVSEDFNIEIKQDDIRVDTYRASGAGGQHVNKTDSAIRITHLKTGLVVTCQNERSQIQNREKAMQVLKAKLYQIELEEQNKKIKELTGSISENAFGSQIRTYTFHPYTLVKDHRTNYEVGNVVAVMDGDLDGFINAYLKSSYN